MSLTREEDILKKIKVASENDPDRPEFPPDRPQFPATSTYRIEVPGFSNVWLKDESENPTGTHKDRMAWEIIVTYRDFLLAKKRGLTDSPLPQMSIISSGSAAIAIQTLLKKYQLPNLKVLVDNNIEPEVINYLEKIGCGVYKTNLAKKPFTWQEILELTNNPKSKAEKLYSPHLPFAHYDEQWIRLYKQAGYCGPASNVYLIEEKYLD